LEQKIIDSYFKKVKISALVGMVFFAIIYLVPSIIASILLSAIGYPVVDSTVFGTGMVFLGVFFMVLGYYSGISIHDNLVDLIYELE
jgi:uncharacterized protein YacL